jgi:hypothetical protein
MSHIQPRTMLMVGVLFTKRASSGCSRRLHVATGGQPRRLNFQAAVDCLQRRSDTG